MNARQRQDLATLAPDWRGVEKPWLDVEASRTRVTGTHASPLTRELWKYTPLADQISALYEAPAASGAAWTGLEQPGIRATLLGAGAQAATRTAAESARALIAGSLDGHRHLLADLALLHGRDAWLVEIAGTAEGPIGLRQSLAGTSVVVLVLKDGARATLIEHPSQAAGTQVMVVCLGRGARLEHHRAAFPAHAHWSLLQAELDDHAEYRLRQLALGGRRARIETHVRLAGRGATTELTGAYLVAAGQHLDQQLVVEHRAPDTTSRQQFHGIGTGKGRSVFNGRIHIHPHAPRSDAWLSNRNLALHPDAEMNTKPELEIYTDDVRCAHGATVGQLAADALFLLTARGIPEPAARRMLAHAFLRTCIDGPLAAEGTERLLGALP